jgi:hypothetical protein
MGLFTVLKETNFAVVGKEERARTVVRVPRIKYQKRWLTLW